MDSFICLEFTGVLQARLTTRQKIFFEATSINSELQFQIVKNYLILI